MSRAEAGGAAGEATGEAGRHGETMPDGCWADNPLWLAKRSGEGKDRPGGLGSTQLPPQEAAPGLYLRDR